MLLAAARLRALDVVLLWLLDAGVRLSAGVRCGEAARHSGCREMASAAKRCSHRLWMAERSEGSHRCSRGDARFPPTTNRPMCGITCRVGASMKQGNQTKKKRFR